MKLKQVVIRLDNEPGRLLQISDYFAEAQVDLRVLNLTPDERGGTMRVLVNDLNRAKSILMIHHIPAIIEEVVAVGVPDLTGGLVRILDPIFREYINIEYSYAYREGERTVMIFRFSDTDRALSILETIPEADLNLDPLGSLS